MDTLTGQLKTLPAKPGVYLFKDIKGSVLYVGKAKSLRSRVKSYFNSSLSKQLPPLPPPSTKREAVVLSPLSKGEPEGVVLHPSKDLDPAKQQMVPKISNIETIICDSENEALILEANLIRKYRPPFNVLLTDDKHYLFIKITKEEYPRVYSIRKITNDGSRYFGPYSSGRSVRATLKLMQRLFPHRTEKDNPKNLHFPHPLFARDQQFNNLTIEQYKTNIRHIIQFLQGKRQPIINTLREGMRQAAENRQFEKAAIFRDQLQNLERLEGSQSVYLPRKESFDVVSIATQSARSAANVFSIRQGKLLNKNTFLLNHRPGTPEKEILHQFLLQYYTQAQNIPPRVYVPEALPDLAQLPIGKNQQPKLHVPARGKKRQLLRLGETNARQMLAAETVNFQEDKRSAIAARELLRIAGADRAQSSDADIRIEVYDISNIQGQLATGSMIVFINGKPSPKDYRKFRIKTVSGSNDYLMLQEVLHRRFKHAASQASNNLTMKQFNNLAETKGARNNQLPAQANEWALPNLIIMDGGKGQLSSAMNALKETGVSIPLAAIAKREEELFLPGRPDPVRLPYDSDTLFFIQRMRDEAHRFTITYHRKLRSKRATRSLLDDIPGIGPKTKKKLLNRFGSVSAIRQASREELIEAIGASQTKKLLEYL